MEYYGVNRRRAKEYLSIMTPDDIALIRRRLDTGGKR